MQKNVTEKQHLTLPRVEKYIFVFGTGENCISVDWNAGGVSDILESKRENSK